MMTALLAACAVLLGQQSAAKPVLLCYDPSSGPNWSEVRADATKWLAQNQAYTLTINADQLTVVEYRNAYGLKGAKDRLESAAEFLKLTRQSRSPIQLQDLDASSRRKIANLLNSANQDLSRWILTEPNGQVALLAEESLTLSAGGKRLNLRGRSFPANLPDIDTVTRNANGSNDTPISPPLTHSQGGPAIANKPIAFAFISRNPRWQDRSELLKQAIDILAKEALQAIDQTQPLIDDAIAELIKKGTGNTDAIPPNASTQSLPEALQRQLEKDLTANFRAYGFNSPEEAKQFLQNATVARTRMNAGLAIRTKLDQLDIFLNLAGS